MKTLADFDEAAAIKYMIPNKANVTELLKREARADAEMEKLKEVWGLLVEALLVVVDKR